MATSISALTYIEWEKYDEARQPLEKALALNPDDARALYYMALVERRARHSEAEIADLEKVVAQYPELPRRAPRAGNLLLSAAPRR